MATTGASQTDTATTREHQMLLVKGDQRWSFRWSAGDERHVARAAVELAAREGNGFEPADAARVARRVLDGNQS